MASLLKKISTITEKGQTTIPKPVREALGVDYGGRIAFYIDENRRVSIEREDDVAEDPVIEEFLAFLARDMRSHPERAVVDIPAGLRGRIDALTEGMAEDLDAPIEGDVAL